MSDWCKDQGGRWVTIRGNHLCVVNERELGDGSKVSAMIHSKDSKTKFRRYRGVDEETANSVKGALMSYPTDFRGEIKTIEVKDGYLDSKNKILGMNIRVRDKSAIYVSTVGNPVYSTHHEIGHEIWREKVESNSSSMAAWSAISKKPGHPTGYAKSSPEEDFAESIATFKIDSGKLKAMSIDRFVFVSETLEGY